MSKKRTKSLGADIPSGKARLMIGTKEKPGPTILVDDSLATIKAELDKQWAAGHYIAVIEAPGYRLIVDGAWVPHDGGINLRPTQR